VADENFIFQRHAFADESVTGNFAAVANFGPFLDFHEGADLYFIANLATVKIRERKNSDVLAQFDIGCDSLK
jgi:hypothetical protein